MWVWGRGAERWRYATPIHTERRLLIVIITRYNILCKCPPLDCALPFLATPEAFLYEFWLNLNLCLNV